MFQVLQGGEGWRSTEKKIIIKYCKLYKNSGHLGVHFTKGPTVPVLYVLCFYPILFDRMTITYLALRFFCFDVHVFDLCPHRVFAQYFVGSQKKYNRLQGHNHKNLYWIQRLLPVTYAHTHRNATVVCLSPQTIYIAINKNIVIGQGSIIYLFLHHKLICSDCGNGH